MSGRDKRTHGSDREGDGWVLRTYDGVKGTQDPGIPQCRYLGPPVDLDEEPPVETLTHLPPAMQAWLKNLGITGRRITNTLDGRMEASS